MPGHLVDAPVSCSLDERCFPEAAGCSAGPPMPPSRSPAATESHVTPFARTCGPRGVTMPHAMWAMRGTSAGPAAEGLTSDRIALMPQTRRPGLALGSCSRVARCLAGTSMPPSASSAATEFRASPVVSTCVPRCMKMPQLILVRRLHFKCDSDVTCVLVWRLGD